MSAVEWMAGQVQRMKPQKTDRTSSEALHAQARKALRDARLDGIDAVLKYVENLMVHAKAAGCMHDASLYKVIIDGVRKAEKEGSL